VQTGKINYWSQDQLKEIYSRTATGIPAAKKGGIIMYKAVLSTTVLPLDGTYRVETLPAGNLPDIVGVPHYIGHPDTRNLVEALGAVQAETKLFSGLNPGERAVCFPIQQGKSTRVTEGFTSPHQSVSLSDLSVRIITRIG
jgi:hypothetical protein